MGKMIFSLFLLIIPVMLFSQPKKTVAVIDLDPIGVLESDTKIITSRIRTYLVNTNKFVVLERGKMKEILSEQGFQLTGCTSSECLIEMGKLLNVQQIISGSLGKIGRIYTLSLRLIDIETGEIIKTAASDCECNIEEVLKKSVKSVVYVLTNENINQVPVIQINQNKIEKKDDEYYLKIFFDYDAVWASDAIFNFKIYLNNDLIKEVVWKGDHRELIYEKKVKSGRYEIKVIGKYTDLNRTPINFSDSIYLDSNKVLTIKIDSKRGWLNGRYKVHIIE